jgi:starvation-inducible DNA-binding protein
MLSLRREQASVTARRDDYNKLLIPLTYISYTAALTSLVELLTNLHGGKMTSKQVNKQSKKITPITPDLGLPEKSQENVANILKVVLADESVLYQKLRNYHWNVTGHHFFALHAAFEDEYTAVADVIDEVAERIRQYGVYAPGTMQEFKEHTRLSEQPGVHPDPRTMVANLVADHETMIRNLREDIELIDDNDDDVGAEDLLTGILQQHQKMAWMLRMYLEG